MNAPTRSAKLRVAVITELAKRAPSAIGRTGLMKIMYFLQTLRGVDLGYAFRLYTYGPYDSQVLEDLQLAEGLGAVRSHTFEWQSGSGYEIKPGPNAEDVAGHAQVVLAGIRDDIDWVVREFASRSASDLEVASTAVYVAAEQGRPLSLSELASRVHSIKRHHALSKIETEIRRLKEKNLLDVAA